MAGFSKGGKRLTQLFASVILAGYSTAVTMPPLTEGVMFEQNDAPEAASETAPENPPPTAPTVIEADEPVPFPAPSELIASFACAKPPPGFCDGKNKNNEPNCLAPKDTPEPFCDLPEELFTTPNVMAVVDGIENSSYHHFLGTEHIEKSEHFDAYIDIVVEEYQAYLAKVRLPRTKKRFVYTELQKAGIHIKFKSKDIQKELQKLNPNDKWRSTSYNLDDKTLKALARKTAKSEIKILQGLILFSKFLVPNISAEKAATVMYSESRLAPNAHPIDRNGKKRSSAVGGSQFTAGTTYPTMKNLGTKYTAFQNEAASIQNKQHKRDKSVRNDILDQRFHPLIAAIMFLEHAELNNNHILNVDSDRKKPRFNEDVKLITDEEYKLAHFFSGRDYQSWTKASSNKNAASIPSRIQVAMSNPWIFGAKTTSQFMSKHCSNGKNTAPVYDCSVLDDFQKGTKYAFKIYKKIAKKTGQKSSTKDIRKNAKFFFFATKVQAEAKIQYEVRAKRETISLKIKLVRQMDRDLRRENLGAAPEIHIGPVRPKTPATASDIQHPMM